MSVNAFWKLSDDTRSRLLAIIPPVYPDVIADHITLQAGVPDHFPLLLPLVAQIIAVVDDQKGVQALVVSIDGSTDRPDGSTFHITWSIDRSKDCKPVDSNTALRTVPWISIDPIISITVQPEFA